VVLGQCRGEFVYWLYFDLGDSRVAEVERALDTRCRRACGGSSRRKRRASHSNGFSQRAASHTELDLPFPAVWLSTWEEVKVHMASTSWGEREAPARLLSSRGAVFQAGHLPCGWKGRWPRGELTLNGPRGRCSPPGRHEFAHSFEHLREDLSGAESFPGPAGFSPRKAET
jgi:hypothetical protein